MKIDLWSLATWAVDKIPFERMFDKPRSNAADIRELQQILQASPPSTGPAPVTPHTGLVMVKEKVEIKPNPNTTSKVSTQETVDYQNRELGKILIQIERHASQGYKINGKACDCGIKHLPDIESLCEETIPMVSNPDIYYKIITWEKEIGPKITPEANDSGLYTAEYPEHSRQARDFRKELLGTLDYKALFWDKTLRNIQGEKAIKPELVSVSKPVADITNDITKKVQNETDITVKSPDQQEKEDNRPVTSNGTVCQDLKSMADWVDEEDEEKCRICMLTITIPWYYDELKAAGETDLVEELEEIQKEGIPIKIAIALDQIKENVTPEVKQRLLEFDCASQSFEM